MSSYSALRAMQEARQAGYVAIHVPHAEPRRRRIMSPFRRSFTRGFAVGLGIAFTVGAFVFMNVPLLMKILSSALFLYVPVYALFMSTFQSDDDLPDDYTAGS
ncbi:hypothetical protein BRADI_2g57600v3 [Brachypodium distachyon]|uniref:Uncharacterized protein n=1 Tax=Brachypodium distachyon TaxID=15368 RepID=A0A2K2DGG5_BRADI|nr:hypothetical protein BRADI_2g57600v3 [Brachypodium distachyon]